MSVIETKSAEASTSSPTATELAVLNFALNLEYLEAEFYTYGEFGYGIEEAGIATHGVANGTNPTTGGLTTGGAKVTFSNNLVFSAAITHEIGIDERAHVVLLRSFLGSLAIAKPNINLAALSIGFHNQNEYLTLARIFEDIGVSAYGGAAYLLSTPLVIQTAARILAVESQHVGTLHTQIARLNIPSPMLDGADLVPPPSRAYDPVPLRQPPQTGFPPSAPCRRSCIWHTAEPGSPLAASSRVASTAPFHGTASSGPAPAANLGTIPPGFAPALG